MRTSLLPAWCAKIHPKYKTPVVTTILTGIAVALPARRRRPGLQIAAAAAAVLVAAASSLALGHALRGSNRPSDRTATQSISTPSLQQDIVSQHILAMERRLPPAPRLRLGQVVAL